MPLRGRIATPDFFTARVTFQPFLPLYLAETKVGVNQSGSPLRVKRGGACRLLQPLVARWQESAREFFQNEAKCQITTLACFISLIAEETRLE